MFTAVATGFVFGFIGSMPIAGPIAALVFYRGLDDRARGAIALAFGASIPEAVYAGLAFWGFAELISQYRWVDIVSRGTAALVLMGIGGHFALRPRAKPRPPKDPREGQKRNFFLGFTITALNPALIATWTGAVTAVHSLGVEMDTHAAIPFAVAAACGIVSWFALLLALLAKYKARFHGATLERVMRMTGTALFGLGVYFAIRFVRVLG